jgi:hypothetical protein
MLDFEDLKAGRLGISAKYGSFLAEAASFCLHLREHLNPVRLSITGDMCSSENLKRDEINEHHRSTWADLEEATEYGAYGIAVVITLRVAGTPYVQRSAKTTGIDYWLGERSGEHGIFQRTARLEVSGILNGDENKIKARLVEKLAQTKQSDKTRLAAYVAIVEFSLPQAHVVIRMPGERKQ